MRSTTSEREREEREKERTFSGMAPAPYPWVIDSTPAPMPMSIWPAAIWSAMWLTATRPDEHWRLTVATDEVVGKPAASWAMRATVAPPPGGRTLPTWISSTRSLLAPERSMTPSKTALRRSSGHASLRPPFLARVIGVRTAATMTTSSGFFWRRAALPRGVRCETRPERRSLADEAADERDLLQVGASQHECASAVDRENGCVHGSSGCAGVSARAGARGRGGRTRAGRWDVASARVSVARSGTRWEGECAPGKSAWRWCKRCARGWEGEREAGPPR